MSQTQVLPRLGGLYQHYKGGNYKVLLLGKDEETQADVVVYSAEKDSQVWVRPLSEFQPPRFVQAPPTPVVDQPWERFLDVRDRRPSGRGEIVIVKLAGGHKLAASYDGEALTWKCAEWDNKHFNFAQLLPDVLAWRHQASK